MQIIRPMCEVEERDVERLSRVVELPVFSVDCPKKDANHRLIFKEMIRKVARVNRHVKENLYQAPWRINWEYLPSTLEISTDGPRSLPEDGDPEYIREA